ncbi:MAG: heme ABC transporter ATP-binding protein [Flavobacteriales bacterium]
MKGISVQVGRKGPRLLHGISFDAHAGEVLVVLGANGSGKSTLLRTVGGELHPSEGSILWKGRELGRHRIDDLARERAFLDQQSRVPFAFTAQEIVRMGRYPFYAHTPDAVDEEAVDTALEAMHVVDLRHRSMPTLSGGEQQRIHIARVFAQLHRARGTSLLLMDEPLNDLDIRHQHAVLGMARQKAAEGACVIIILHDVDLALRYADRLLLLHGGRVVRHGAAHAILDAAVLEAVYGMPAEVITDPITGGTRVHFGPPATGSRAAVTSSREECAAGRAGPDRSAPALITRRGPAPRAGGTWERAALAASSA